MIMGADLKKANVDAKAKITPRNSITNGLKNMK